MGLFLFGDPKQVRTADSAVKGRCLDHLTMGPYFVCFLVAASRFEPLTLRV